MKKRNKKCLLLISLTSLLCLPQILFALDSRPAVFDDLFEKGDTVAFFGDSITHGGDYHILVQTFLATRYPELELWTENVGRSGGTSWEALRDRLEGDLYDKNPDVVFLHFGMNDVGRDSYKDKKDPIPDAARADRRGRYRDAMTQVVDACLAKGYKVVIISPTLFDDGLNKWNNQHERPHLNTELATFGQIGYELAEKYNLPFIDVHSDMTRITLENQAEDDTFTFTADRVHPKKGGYQIMAANILEDIGVDPVVYEVSIANGKVIKSDHAKIQDIQPVKGGLSWTSIEGRLPFPVMDAGDDKAFGYVDFQKNLNRMILTVEGLAPGSYILQINDEVVDTFTSQDLSGGVNLAEFSTTPQYKTSLALRKGLMNEKLELQSTLRNLNSLRLNMLDEMDQIPEIADIDWSNPDAEAVIDAREKQVAIKKAAGKNTGSYFGYITGQGKKHIGEFGKMNARLNQIRKELNALPTERTFTYQLTMATE